MSEKYRHWCSKPRQTRRGPGFQGTFQLRFGSVRRFRCYCPPMGVVPGHQTKIIRRPENGVVFGRPLDMRTDASTHQNGFRLPAGNGALVAELRGYVARHRKIMSEQIRNSRAGAGRDASWHYSRAIDGLLGALFEAVRAVAMDDSRWVECSLSAVGSYGRGNLAYSSDLDVRLLGHSVEATGVIAEA